MARVPLLIPLFVASACTPPKQPPATALQPPTQPVMDATAQLPRALQAEAVQTLRDNFRRVRFATNSHAIEGASREALQANASILIRYPGLVVEIQGHADERGTTDYNLALGQRRSASVRQFLTEHGVYPDQLRALSYGEERPQVAGSDESAWSTNRRAEFRVIEPHDRVVGTVTR